MIADPTSRKIAAAARRLLDDEGADAVTMRRVAGLVGITPMAVYRHYADRTDLLNHLADAGFAELGATLTSGTATGSVEQRLRRMLDRFLEFSLENPRLFELMFLKPRKGARQFPQDFEAGRSPTASPMAELIQEGIRNGNFRDGNIWEMALEMGALLQGLVMLFVGGRMAMTAEEFRAFCHRSFERYIRGIQK